MPENWWTEMEQRIAAANAEKDRQSMEQMRDQIEKDRKATMATIELAEKMAAKTTDARRSMETEIADIQAEADRQIQNTKDRYAANYGNQTWNTETEELWRKVAKSTVKKE